MIPVYHGNDRSLSHDSEEGNEAVPSYASLDSALRWGRDQCERAFLAPQEAVWLLEWALGTRPLVRADQQMSGQAAARYRAAIAQRVAHTPLQHITGEMDFRYLTLAAGPGVFLTRPETEMLVDLALDSLRQGPAQIADLCAGSGAIGLALATERANTSVVAVEVDPEAEDYLLRNVAGCTPFASGSSVEVVREDATVGLSGRECTFDVVVSNPPYVGVEDAPTQTEARLDPPLALYGGGNEGLEIPRRIVARSYTLLLPGGTLVMEHGQAQGSALTAHAREVGFATVKTVKDLTDRPRFLVATTPIETY